MAHGNGIQPCKSGAPEVIEVAAGLVFRDQQLLITQRHPEDHLGGLWEFPGGKREPNESFEQCVVRELKEELGIEVVVHDLVESLRHDYAERRVLIRFYRCGWLKHEPRAIGCQDFKWIASEDLVRYSFPPADARLLAKLGRSATLWSAVGRTG